MWFVFICIRTVVRQQQTGMLPNAPRPQRNAAPDVAVAAIGRPRRRIAREVNNE